MIKCNLIDCVTNNSKGICEEFLPNVIPKLNPNNKNCYMYENEEIRQKLIQNIKNKRKYEKSNN
jgi:hypothetical protein